MAQSPASPPTSPLRTRTGAAAALAVAALLALVVSLLSVQGTAHAAGVTATVTKNSVWDTGYTAAVTISNTTSSTVDGWTVTLDLPSGTTVSSHWDARRSGSGGSYTFTGAGWNDSIAPGGSVSFGFVAGGTGDPTGCTVNGAPCSGGSDPDPDPDPGTGETPVEEHGRVHVCGTTLCDESGAPVQLRGMSTHGIQWYDGCLTDGSLDALADDWMADVIRLSMYIQEDGYETDPRGFTDRMHQLIDEATERGMYVIVDWHMLTPGDPHYNTERAKTFFAEIADRHAGKTNVLYEIANEPNGDDVDWSSIKSYAEEVIPVIRSRDADSVVLVGTPGWSSLGVSQGNGPDEIIGNPVDADNIMYTFHFYAATHRDQYLDALDTAVQRIPVFVTEFGTETASGDGGHDFAMAERYLDLMERENISWTKWNYSDDFRSGAAFTPGTCAAGGPWNGSSLKESGTWARDQIRAGSSA
ncbi:cellulase family glycosylhydrolase [Actinorugispora endophytica]|uniref:Endoglucanase n=1 Tax=Actinorugispora endophytica TaxID=1605990 RepID=A0A4R6UVV8_9ACTN|nr:cellulase family glycosylhydrolase [Actinorugispora endophytica]TDQ51528.1 endoglucanase [Actinorugispora endophytica]